MERPISLIAVLLTLGFGACGGGDETSSTAGTPGATGVQGATSSGTDMTAGEFMQASIPDQIEAVKDAAEANPDCAEADTTAGSNFQVQVAIDAAGANPNTPLAEIVSDNC